MKKIIVANWKMYLTLSESVALARRLAKLEIRNCPPEADPPWAGKLGIIVCPSFVALEEVEKVVRGTRIKLGAQDVEPERRGAYTGEVGLDDLRELGVEYVLVGHSERRRYFKETDAVVNKKLRAVLHAGMRPILCVGEPSRPSPHPLPRGEGDRRSGEGIWAAQRYVAKQVRAGLKGVSKKELKRVVIAYEPVWAIGTGRADSPEDASKMHAYIRNVLDRGLSFTRGKDSPRSPRVPILYGGSVDSKNAAAFARAPGVDGLLIGRASTRFPELSKICSQ